MKRLVLAATLIASMSGCATNGYNNDAAYESQVRDWMRTELNLIYIKQDMIADLFSAGRISIEEYQLLMDDSEREKRSLPQRVPTSF